MKQWFFALAPRERLWVVLGVVATIILLLWFYAWTPLLKYQQTLQNDIAATADDALYLEELRATVNASRKPQGEFDTKTKVQRVVTPVLQRYRLNDSKVLVRLQDQGNNGAQLTLKNAPFDQLVRFLSTLEQQHGIVAAELTLKPNKTSGLTDASITLKR